MPSIMSQAQLDEFNRNGFVICKSMFDRTEVELLLRTREPLYRACADLTIDTTAHSPEDIVHLILSSLTPDP